MKARITFYFAAVVALVLFLASMQSHATERRDPLIIQDTPTTQAARSSNMVRSTASATKPSQSSSRKAKPGAANSGKSHDSNAPVGAKDKPNASAKPTDATPNPGATRGGAPYTSSSR